MMKTMFNGLVAASLALAAGTAAAEFSANAALTSDYMFYGASQTSEGWAIQGGFDYAFEETGIYLGSWASTVDFTKSLGGTAATDPATIELDVFGGIAGELASGLTWDFGIWAYMYPDQNEDVGADYDYFEVYANFGYTFAAQLDPTVSAGVYISPDFFGENGTSYYPSLQFDLTLPQDFGVYAKVAYLDVEDLDLSYTHYKVGVSKDLVGLTFDASWNDAEDDCGDDLCEGFVFAVSKSF